jgi:uncharacterized protein
MLKSFIQKIPNTKISTENGSHARRNASEDSDIDILIVLQDSVSPGDEILRISTLKTDLNLKRGELISVTPISEIDYQTRSTLLLENICREGTIL